jgi:hypothetical protein
LSASDLGHSFDRFSAFCFLWHGKRVDWNGVVDLCGLSWVFLAELAYARQPTFLRPNLGCSKYFFIFVGCKSLCKIDCMHARANFESHYCSISNVEEVFESEDSSSVAIRS